MSKYVYIAYICGGGKQLIETDGTPFSRLILFSRDSLLVIKTKWREQDGKRNPTKPSF